MTLTHNQIVETVARLVSTGWEVKGTTVTFENTDDALTDAEIEAAFNAYQYKAKRSDEYPSISEQLDMIYHAGQGGDAFQAAIKAVKDKYPKP
jgi:hypothetical protein